MAKKYEKYMIEIPLVPEVAANIIRMNSDSKELSSVYLTQQVSLDPYLSASILKIANSALYSRRSEINEIQTAVNLIGFKKIKTMVLLLAGASLINKNENKYFYNLYWRHSLISAFICKEIALMTDKKNRSDEYFTSSLIHRIGMIPLFLSDRENYLRLLKENEEGEFRLIDLEQEHFGAHNCKVGSSLMEYWHFPQTLVDSADYDNPMGEDQQLLDSICLADYITIELGFGINDFIETEKKMGLIKTLALKEDDYEYLISEAYMDKIKQSSFYLECQQTLDINMDFQ